MEATLNDVAHHAGVGVGTVYRRFATKEKLIDAIFEEGIAEGTLRPVDPETAASVIVSLAVGFLLQALLDPHGADWGQAVQEGIRMLFKGLERKR